MFARDAQNIAYKLSIFTPKSRVAFEAAECIGVVKDRQWYFIGFDKIKAHYKLYNQMLLGRRSFIVSHSQQVSVFDLISNEWVQHLSFDSKVQCLLKSTTEEYGQQSIFIVLESG
jgi:hypothetical protein